MLLLFQTLNKLKGWNHCICSQINKFFKKKGLQGQLRSPSTDTDLRS